MSLHSALSSDHKVNGVRVLESYHAYFLSAQANNVYRIKLCWKATREIKYNEHCYCNAADGS